MIDAVTAIAKAQGASAAQVSLAWLQAQPAVTSVILGARTTDQLADNLGAADLALDAEEIATLTEASAPHMPDYPYGTAGIAQRHRKIEGGRYARSKTGGRRGGPGGIFAGEDPFAIARAWLAEAEASEPNDPSAMALATVDAAGMPNVRMVLLKEIEAGAFVFYTNYESAKAGEIDAAGKAAFVMHWKSLRRQLRARGAITREVGPAGRRLLPLAQPAQPARRLGLRPVAAAAQPRRADGRGGEGDGAARHRPAAPAVRGGYRLVPVEIEFWADGAHRLHDRFRWTRRDPATPWQVTRLNP